MHKLIQTHPRAATPARTRWYSPGGPTRRAAVLAALAVGLAGAIQAQPALQALPTQQVAEQIWFVQGEAALGSPANRNFISNAAFIVTAQGVVVIDGLGSPALARALLATIRQHTDRPIRYVVVTHYHADHIYGLQVLKEAGATILARAEGREYLNSEAARQRLIASREAVAPWIDEQTRLVPADRWLTEDITLPMGDETLQVRHVGPAHTAEDLVVFAERAGVLLAGDLVFRGRIPYVGQADSRAWITALDQLIALRPRRLLPGHGPLSDEPLADLRLTRDYLQYLRERMGRAAAEMEPFDEAYARTDWSAFEHLPLFRAANRINAYNTYLLMEQQGR